MYTPCSGSTLNTRDKEPNHAAAAVACELPSGSRGQRSKREERREKREEKREKREEREREKMALVQERALQGVGPRSKRLRTSVRARSFFRRSDSSSNAKAKAEAEAEAEASTRGGALEIRTVKSVSEVDRDEWNACANGSGEVNPFLSWEFLSALEESGSVSARQGWQPMHAVLTRNEKETEGTKGTEGNNNNGVLGVCPLYLKGHSYGEYVFDHSWAQAYTRVTGRSYYPKIQSCVPFSPVTGNRLLVKSGEHREESLKLLSNSLVAVADQMQGVSSLHITFNTEEERQQLCTDAGYLSRFGIQYHWHNKGYESFDDFLMHLRQSKRKAIRQERKYVLQKSGLKVYRKMGSEMSAKDWDDFYRFYINTCNKKWGEAYLNRDFFHLLGELLQDKVMVVFVEDAAGRKVAGALNLVGSDTLFGRNWGCKNGLNVKHLHFEVCYYQALDAAIELGLGKVEAGAQGEHKIQRGYLPTLTYSAHYIKDPRFRTVVKDFLKQEQQQIDYTLDVLNQELSPYKKSG